VPAAPALCAQFLQSTGAGAEAPCPDDPARLTALDAALAENDGAKRDRRLVELERCPTFLTGLVRALRAELAPAACADVLVADYLEALAQRPRKDLEDALIGLALASRLSRLVRDPPKFDPPHDKPHFREFFDGRLVPWISAQAQAIQELSLEGSRLGGYGKGVAAIAAGLADMRFVEVVRGVGLPRDLAQDPELRDSYYVALDQALEPRKARGRDAALVGLREFAAEGILHDERVHKARSLLSKLYAGRRVDALDGLLLAELPPFAPSSVEERLAAELPTFYAGLLLETDAVSELGMLRAFLERGLPARTRTVLASAKLSPKPRELYARALFALGQRYWRSADFKQAADQFADPAAPPAPEAALVGALARTLLKGPSDAADMMRRGPFVTSALADVSALDSVAATKSPSAGLAAFDAAYILGLVPPAGPDKEFFKQLAARYRNAAKLLANPTQRRLAVERAKAAEDTARAIR
jgi:hypothetical protein